MVKKKKEKTRPRLAGDSARMIAIDIDIHKSIETARRSFDETESDILRRLIGLDGRPPAEPWRKRRAKGGGAVEGGWSKIDRHGRHVFLPDGTELRAAYGGATILGRIEAGQWRIGDERYNSPSAALAAHVATKQGSPVNLNGWRHWEIRRPGSEAWTRLAEA